MKFRKKKVIIILLLSLIIFIPKVYAQEFTHTISNSEDWRDVYSTIHYSNLKQKSNDFLVSTAHGPLLLNNIRKSNYIRVISSKKRPYVFNYPEMIRSRGFKGADEIKVDSANLELIKDLPDINNFIIVGDSYGYNAMAVASYGVITNSWVFLANKKNIYDIDSILSKRKINKILIYGYVDRQVKNVLSKYNPEIISTGNKFKDNIEIVKKYLEVKPTKQVVLTNGEFLEKEIMNGAEPVLFTGRQNVPDQIRDYLKNSDITVGVLIGNELVSAATNIRRSSGISVMVKFARGARAQKGGISAVEGLDLFPVPTPYLEILLHSIKYNKVTKQLEVTYQSNSNVPTYLKGTITLISKLDNLKVGDLDPVFIAPGDYKTISYSVDLTSIEELKAKIYTLFGETSSALDRVLESETDVETIEVIDNCKIEVLYVKYNKQKKEFIIKTKNTANVNCWVDIELNDIIIDEIPTILGTKGSTKILAGKTKKIKIKQELTKEDLEKNPLIDLTARYGEKQDSLIKVLKGKFELKIEYLTTMTYIIIILAIIIIILIIFFLILKRKNEEDEY